MEKYGISVIIPMLNSEKYIEECITSLLSQGDVVKEILCVDNGSVDQTTEIVLRMQKSDERIKNFSCDRKGVSAARNYGLQRAGGRYIMFVDSDDYLRGKYLSGLYKKAVKTDADILVFGGTSTEPLKTPHWVRKVLSPRNRMCIVSECENIFQERGVVPAAWNKLYKAGLIQELQFSEQLKIAEDKLFQFYAFAGADKVLFVNKRLYVYRMHADSVMNHTDEEEKKEQHELAVRLAEQWVADNRPGEATQNMLERFKETFVFRNNERHGISKLRFYMEEYGLRSFAELMIARVFYKNKV